MAPMFRMKLRYNIDIKYFNFKNLSNNPNAIHFLEQNMDKINWNYLSLNPNAIP